MFLMNGTKHVFSLLLPEQVNDYKIHFIFNQANTPKRGYKKTTTLILYI